MSLLYPCDRCRFGYHFLLRLEGGGQVCHGCYRGERLAADVERRTKG